MLIEFRHYTDAIVDLKTGASINADA